MKQTHLCYFRVKVPNISYYHKLHPITWPISFIFNNPCHIPTTFCADAAQHQHAEFDLTGEVTDGRPFSAPNTPDVIEEYPAASCRESPTVRNFIYFLIRSLTPQQATGNALAVAVHK